MTSAECPASSSAANRGRAQSHRGCALPCAGCLPHTPEAHELRTRPPPRSQADPPQIHQPSATSCCAHRWQALTAAWRGPWTARPALQRQAHRSLLALPAAARRQRALRQVLRQLPLRPAVQVCHGVPAGRTQGHGGGCRRLAAVQAGVRGAAPWRRRGRQRRVAAAGGRHPCSSRGGSGPFVQGLPRLGQMVEDAQRAPGSRAAVEALQSICGGGMAGSIGARCMCEQTARSGRCRGGPGRPHRPAARAGPVPWAPPSSRSIRRDGCCAGQLRRQASEQAEWAGPSMTCTAGALQTGLSSAPPPPHRSL